MLRLLDDFIAKEWDGRRQSGIVLAEPGDEKKMGLGVKRLWLCGGLMLLR